jgi:hypothetical protein
VINADNGPENSGIRTQWLKRLVEFAALHQVDVQLVCYPPYLGKWFIRISSVTAATTLSLMANASMWEGFPCLTFKTHPLRFFA